MNGLLMALKNFFRDENGVTAIEYAVLASLIILAVVATVLLVGQQLDAVFKKIQDCLTDTAKCKAAAPTTGG